MAGRRSNSRGRDMLISMLVLALPVLGIYWLFALDPEPQVETVEVGPVLARAQEESPYPVLYAQDLPEQWLPTRVAWAPLGQRWITGEPATANAWQLGYLSPEGTYVAVQQRDAGARAFLDEVTRDGAATGGSVQAAGRTWQRWRSQDGRTESLVWNEDQVVAVITSDGGYELLEAFASTLTTG